METRIDTQVNVDTTGSWLGNWSDLSAFWHDPSQSEHVGDFARILEAGS